MRRGRFAPRAVALAAFVILTACAGACTKPVGGTLVVVTVDAVPALPVVARLHTTSMAGGETVTKDVGGDGPTFALGGGETKDFGIDVRAAITGTFSIVVEAESAAGVVLARGESSATLAPGKRVDLAVTLTPPGGLDGGLDGATDGGAPDLGPLPDLTAPPDLTPVVTPVQPQPLWVGSGGAASKSGRRLTLNVSGFDTVGTTQANSGARLASPFAAQAY